MHKAMFRKNMLLIVVLIMSFTLWLSACGEDEVSLSDLIVGSWMCTDEEFVGTMLYPAGDEILTARMDATLTFYKAGGFDHVYTMSFSVDNEEIGIIKFTTEGTYEVFDKTVVFRAQHSDIQTFWWPPELGDFMDIFIESTLDSMVDLLESMFTETYSIEIRRKILTLDDLTWQRI